VHGILDDRSRFVVALRACENEREVDLLSVLCEALLRFPAPDSQPLPRPPAWRGDVARPECRAARVPRRGLPPQAARRAPRQTPVRVFQAGITSLPGPKAAKELAQQLEVTTTRKVRGDGTFTVDAALFEVGGRHLAGKTIDLVLDAFTGQPLRASHQGTAVPIGRCDPTANARRRRPAPAETSHPTTPFDPIAALLAAARKEIPDV
jgi:hypothetical protein